MIFGSRSCCAKVRAACGDRVLRRAIECLAQQRAEQPAGLDTLRGAVRRLRALTRVMDRGVVIGVEEENYRRQSHERAVAGGTGIGRACERLSGLLETARARPAR
jgi:hypothetical protein